MVYLGNLGRVITLCVREREKIAGAGGAALSVPEVEGLQSHCGDPAELRSPTGPGRGLRDTGDSSLASVAVPDCKAEPLLVCGNFGVPRTKEELRI